MVRIAEKPEGEGRMSSNLIDLRHAHVSELRPGLVTLQDSLSSPAGARLELSCSRDSARSRPLEIYP